MRNEFRSTIVLASTFMMLGSCQMIFKSDNIGDSGRIQPTPPANVPSADYPLTEFRDNRGCDYILAGEESRKIWVPLVTVSGSHICGGQSVEYNVGPGVDDIHGTLSAPAPAPVAPQAPTQVSDGAAPEQSGGIMGFISNIFGGSDNSQADVEPQSNATQGQDIVIYEDQITRSPGAVVETSEVDVVTVPAAPQTSAPTPPTPTPAPTAEPTQRIVAPAPVANPNLAVQFGNFSKSRGREIVRQMRDLGYQVNTVDLGTSLIVQVIPQAGQSTQALQQTMRSLGYSEAILVGIMH